MKRELDLCASGSLPIGLIFTVFTCVKVLKLVNLFPLWLIAPDLSCGIVIARPSFALASVRLVATCLSVGLFPDCSYLIVEASF